ncbi:hypothetical protein JCM17960_17170 [Magnetospira thiophila]
MFGALLGPLVAGLFSVVDKAVEDEDAKIKIKGELQTMILTGQMKEIEQAASIIVAEANGESWLQRNWRPMLMCLFGIIIANNYIVSPITGSPSMPLPPDMWELLKIGVGGYVVGRSVEKGVKVWKEGGK